MNLWDMDVNVDARCITTNGDYSPQDTRKGIPIKAVMGRGVAKQARIRYPGLDNWFAMLLEEKGNHVHMLLHPLREGGSLLSFPVKHHWNEHADITLIKRSAHELSEYAEGMKWQKIWLPRPGCGNGGLLWRYVKPAIEPILDDRFTVLDLP